MQKILRRVNTAERVAVKRQKVKALGAYKRDRREDFDNQVQHVARVRTEIEDAKQIIRDDWAAGPIAPRTDVGEAHNAFGAISSLRYNRPSYYRLTIRNARCQWAGGAYYLCLAKGDRVVLLEGPDKGRVGVVHDINKDTAELTVKDLNKACSPPSLFSMRKCEQ